MPEMNVNQKTDIPVGHRGSGDGLYLRDLADGTVVEIETQHRNYRLVKRADSHVRISGHPTYCPEPVDVVLEGSIPVGSTLVPEPGFIGRGMYLLMKHPTYNWITTSRIRDIHKLG